MSESPIIEQLNTIFTRLNLNYTRISHPPLASCKDASKLGISRPGHATKHLLLRDNYGRRHFLLVTEADNQVDLKSLTKQLGVSRLGFASSQRLMKHLAVLPGHVSLLALINDKDNAVEVLIDQSLLAHAQWQLLVLNNSVTWAIPRKDVLSFVAHCGQSSRIITIPTQ